MIVVPPSPPAGARATVVESRIPTVGLLELSHCGDGLCNRDADFGFEAFEAFGSIFFV
jgi:hypothetical protein